MNKNATHSRLMYWGSRQYKYGETTLTKPLKDIIYSDSDQKIHSTDISYWDVCEEGMRMICYAPQYTSNGFRQYVHILYTNLSYPWDKDPSGDKLTSGIAIQCEENDDILPCTVANLGACSYKRELLKQYNITKLIAIPHKKLTADVTLKLKDKDGNVLWEGQLLQDTEALQEVQFNLGDIQTDLIRLEADPHVNNVTGLCTFAFFKKEAIAQDSNTEDVTKVIFKANVQNRDVDLNIGDDFYEVLGVYVVNKKDTAAEIVISLKDSSGAALDHCGTTTIDANTEEATKTKVLTPHMYGTGLIGKLSFSNADIRSPVEIVLSLRKIKNRTITEVIRTFGDGDQDYSLDGVVKGTVSKASISGTSGGSGVPEGNKIKIYSGSNSMVDEVGMTAQNAKVFTKALDLTLNNNCVISAPLRCKLTNPSATDAGSAITVSLTFE